VRQKHLEPGRGRRRARSSMASAPTKYPNPARRTAVRIVLRWSVQASMLADEENPEPRHLTVASPARLMGAAHPHKRQQDLTAQQRRTVDVHVETGVHATPPSIQHCASSTVQLLDGRWHRSPSLPSGHDRCCLIRPNSVLADRHAMSRALTWPFATGGVRPDGNAPPSIPIEKLLVSGVVRSPPVTSPITSRPA
jgi:hypothetical protein